MSQRDKEETRLEMIESLSLCINNCGVYGNPSTKNMCQTCFESSTKIKISTTTTNTKSSSIQSPNESDLILQEEEGKLSKKALVQSLTFSSSEKFRSSTSVDSDLLAKIHKSDDLMCKIDEKKVPVEEKKIVRAINRCSGCRRKVGLTGFRCRCGELFCPEHRYSDRHDCSFDYKSHGREAIARENPVVRPAKILKV